jgi:hypothetical protein
MYPQYNNNKISKLKKIRPSTIKGVKYKEMKVKANILEYLYLVDTVRHSVHISS